MAGYCARKCYSDSYEGPDADIAAWYGYEKNMPGVMEDYLKAGKKVVFVDLGYWGRARKSRLWGYHKVAVNGRHPGDYLMRKNLPDKRFQRFGLQVYPWRKNGEHILLAGMSGRAAESIGYRPEEWERWAIGEIRKHSGRKIVYRPKPTWVGATRLKGTIYDSSTSPLVSLKNCHAVVTHHSNVAIDGLIEGVPAFCFDGAAKPMSLQDLSKIEEPIEPDNREQWLANLAWCQWDINEMKSGQMWRHMRRQGLIP